MELICQFSYLIWTRISDFVDKGVIMTFLDVQDPALQIQRGRGGAQAGQVKWVQVDNEYLLKYYLLIELLAS